MSLEERVESLEKDIEALKKLRFDAAILLEGWEQSSGSNKELVASNMAGTIVFTSFDELCKWRDAVECVEKESVQDDYGKWKGVGAQQELGASKCIVGSGCCSQGIQGPCSVR